MKNITQNYKNSISRFGRELDSLITYTINNQEVVLSSEELNQVTPSFKSDILKSSMKQLKIDSNVEIPIDTVINYQFGVKVSNNEVQDFRDNYEYINYGDYIVYSVEKKEDTDSYDILCYDYMLNSMKEYESFAVYPISIRNYIRDLCTKIGLTFKNQNQTFVNWNKVIENELYLDSNGKSLGYTYRDVLDELAEVTASTICINEEDNQLEIRYINNTNDEIDEEFFKDINVNFGKKFGVVNAVVLSRADESDSIYRRDEESIEENGLCEVKIKDNQIMNFNDRDEYIDGIYNQLLGLEYYINDYSSPGITYYEICDRYNVRIKNNVYSCVMFNDETIVTQGLEENVNTPLPETNETNYKYASKTDKTINQAYIIAKKQEGEIESLTRRTSSLEDETGNMYSIEQVNSLIENAETGLTNTFSEAGGNNIFRNTGLWFTTNDLSNPYEFWNGVVEKQKEDKASNMSALLLQNGTLEQEQLVPNGKYTISFKYKKIVFASIIKAVINDVEYVLSETEETLFTQTIEVSSQHINIKFISDVNNACEIYDLMANAGEIALAYSQNQNETTTDTVNISKGIEITSSDIDVRFKANADGIRTIDRSGNELTKFTDTGMKTKEAIITEKSQIVGTLWQEVNRQTWITRL